MTKKHKLVIVFDSKQKMREYIQWYRLELSSLKTTDDTTLANAVNVIKSNKNGFDYG